MHQNMKAKFSTEVTQHDQDKDKNRLLGTDPKSTQLLYTEMTMLIKTPVHVHYGSRKSPNVKYIFIHLLKKD